MPATRNLSWIKEKAGTVKRGSVLLDHHLGRFHHGDDRVALFEFQFVGCAG